MITRHPIPSSKVGTKTSQVGLTLLELLISLSLGLLLAAGIGTIYVGSNQTYRVQEQNSRIQESGRYALELIGRSLRQAGSWNIPLSPIDNQTGFSGTPITATDGGAGTPPPPDTVTVQYDGIAGDRDCEGTVLAANAIIQETISLDTANLELECEGTDVDVASSPLLSNVEDLQFVYGIDSTGDQSADRYVAAPTAAQLPLVVSARACVLIQSNDQGIAATAQTYLNCAGALGTATGSDARSTATDSRLRRTFVATFNLRNRVTNLP